MSNRGLSLNSNFELVRLPHIQLEKYLVFYFPDPDSAFLANGGAQWSWEVWNETTATVIQAATQTTATEDYAHVQLVTGTFVAGNRYRVRIFDNSALLVYEWYFIAYESNLAGTAPSNIALLNENITRLAGLLGLNQKVTNTEFELGVPIATTIQVFDKDPTDLTAVQIGEYKQKRFLDTQGRVAAEVSSRES